MIHVACQKDKNESKISERNVTVVQVMELQPSSLSSNPSVDGPQ